MYSITETPEIKILVKLPNCRRIFTANGKIVEFGKKATKSFPKDTIISVNRVNHWELHNIRMIKTRQVLRDNATITEKDLTGSLAETLEEEILLASLEVIEVL